jgi:hypothetical protein
LVSRTRAILRNAEFGFLGCTVRTTKQTPLLKGFPRKAGAALLLFKRIRPFLTNWLMVGIHNPPLFACNIAVSFGVLQKCINPTNRLFYFARTQVR